MILCDSPNGTFTLVADKGIILNPDSHLIIWGQSGGTGKIQTYGEEYHPGIGGNASSGNSGNLTINGGNIIVSGGIGAPGLGSCGSDSGVITINGGSVNATGGHIVDTGEKGAPGIGANDMPESGGAIVNNGTLNIDGGTISGNVSLKDGGAVYNSGTLNLNGGTISDNRAGSGTSGSGGAISAHELGDMLTITGTAANGEDSSGIKINVSPLSYVNAVLSNDFDKAAKDAMSAFYSYYTAVVDYNNRTTNS